MTTTQLHECISSLLQVKDTLSKIDSKNDSHELLVKAHDELCQTILSLSMLNQSELKALQQTGSLILAPRHFKGSISSDLGFIISQPVSTSNIPQINDDDYLNIVWLRPLSFYEVYSTSCRFPRSQILSDGYTYYTNQQSLLHNLRISDSVLIKHPLHSLWCPGIILKFDDSNNTVFAKIAYNDYHINSNIHLTKQHNDNKRHIKIDRINNIDDKDSEEEEEEEDDEYKYLSTHSVNVTNSFNKSLSQDEYITVTVTNTIDNICPIPLSQSHKIKTGNIISLSHTNDSSSSRSSSHRKHVYDEYNNDEDDKDDKDDDDDDEYISNPSLFQHYIDKSSIYNTNTNINSSYKKAPVTFSTLSGLGDWERHTKGVGSKLLYKMGYKRGEGLGKESQGISRPIESLIKPLPQGLSLDFISQYTNVTRINSTTIGEDISASSSMKRLCNGSSSSSSFTSTTQKKSKTTTNSSSTTEPNSNVFGFLNTINTGNTNIVAAGKSMKIQSSTSSKSTTSTSTSTKYNINQQISKLKSKSLF